MRSVPLYFGADHGVFGHLHPAPVQAQEQAREQRPAPNGLGVVICSPFGAEEMSARQTLRHIAQCIAQAGLPCLRFDYPGCGDSSDTYAADAASATHAQGGTLPEWLASVHAAIDELKARTGVPRIVVLGVRLGALLAAQAALARSDVSGLMAVAPVYRGRSFIREYKMLGMSAQRFESQTEQRADGSIESGGFVLGAELCAQLQSADLLKLKPQPTPESADAPASGGLARALLIERDDMPLDARWAEHLQACGIEVEHVSLPGYAELMQVAHHAVAPQAMVDAALSWLTREQARHDTANPAATLPGLVSQATWPVPAPGGRVPIVERAVNIDIGTTPCALFGIVTQPARPAGSRVGVLLVNTGAEHHVGPNRMYVGWARHWAARGLTVLRLDLAGLGDSDERPGSAAQQVYPDTAMDDLRAATAYMHSELGASEVHAIGLCSGAYHVYKAAVAGVPLASATAINPLVFFWKPGLSLDFTAQEGAVVAVNAQLSRSLMQRERWLKLLKGQANVRFIALMLGRRIAMAVRDAARGLARQLGMPLKDDIERELKLIERRGMTRLQFVFAENEPGLTLLRKGAPNALGPLQAQGRLRIETLNHADHTFTRHEARQRLFDVVNAALAPDAHQASGDQGALK